MTNIYHDSSDYMKNNFHVWEAVAKALKKEPYINRNGFGKASNFDFWDRDAFPIFMCMEWLKARRKTITPKVGSYGLKHTIQKQLGFYVSNGHLLVATIGLDFPYKKNGINALIGINKRDICKGKSTMPYFDYKI